MKRKDLKKFKRAVLRSTIWVDSITTKGETVKVGVAGDYTVELRTSSLIIRGLNDYYKFVIKYD